MLVEFLEEWCGSKVGEVLDLNECFVKNDLLPRKMVKLVKTDEETIIEQQATEIAELKKKLKAKMIAAAPIDKQVKGADNK